MCTQLQLLELAFTRTWDLQTYVHICGTRSTVGSGGTEQLLEGRVAARAFWPEPVCTPDLEAVCEHV